MTKTNPWFRIHSQALSNPKIQKLDPEVFKIWFNLLCVTNDDVSSIIRVTKCNDIIWSLRVSEERYNEVIELLLNRDLLIKVEGGYQPKDWHEWQYTGEKKGSSTARVQKFRDKKRQEMEQSGDVSKTLQKRPPEAETEAETEKKEDLFSGQDTPVQTRVDYKKLFEEWWVLYPTKIAKIRCAEIYKKLLKGGSVSHDQMMSGLRAYLKCEKVEKGFILNPKKWLDEGHWGDTYAPARNGMNGHSVLPKSVSPDQWRERVGRFAADRETWSGNWGPKPTEPGCYAPAEVLKQFQQKHAGVSRETEKSA